ncbi:Magnesium-dependent phosphatase 1 [Irineochytrium annulatum]|nr:Magnesium-dependent phosphatase 1 [Irineochytrium annulatum]
MVTNPHREDRVNRTRTLYLRLSIIPILLGACNNIYMVYVTNRTQYDDTATRALRIGTTLNAALWFTSCNGFLAVILVARRGLFERLKDIVEAQSLLEARCPPDALTDPSASPCAGAKPHQPFEPNAARKESSGGTYQLDKPARKESSGVTSAEARLVASVNGAIWSLTALAWCIAAIIVYSVAFGAVVMAIGYPPWIYFLVVGFLHGLLGVAPFPVFAAVLGRQCMGPWDGLTITFKPLTVLKPISMDFDAITCWPRLIIFDLDETLWNPWIDITRGPPFNLKVSRSHLSLKDAGGGYLNLFPDVPAVLEALCSRTDLGIASRTAAIDWAGIALDEFIINERRMRDFFREDAIQIFPGRKIEHFNNIAAATGVPLRDMLFFDDERRNITGITDIDVSKLGVTCFLVDKGTSWSAVRDGLTKYQDNKRSAGMMKSWLKPAEKQ